MAELFRVTMVGALGEPNIVIATATDGSFLPAACCQIASAAAHVPSANSAELHLVCCDVTDSDIEEAQSFFAHRSINVEITIPDFVEERIKPIENRWPRAAYLRLWFDSIFGTDCDRLVYFDADTRVCSSLQPLLDVDLKGKPVGAVHDFILYVTGNIRRYRRDLFLADDAPYLQSGVMVFDWPATLSDGALERARKFLAKYPERCLEAPDQNALNAALEGKWTPIDPRWNLHELYLMFGGQHKPRIEHYTSTKPWSRYRPDAWRAAADWYDRQLQGTAWAEFVPRQTLLDRLISKSILWRRCYGPRVREALARYAPMILDVIGKSRKRSFEEGLPWVPNSTADVETMTNALIDEAAERRVLIRPPERILL